MNHSNTTLSLADGSTLVFPYNSHNNLPLMLPSPTRNVGLTFEDACVLGDGYSVRNFMSVADETNQNLTASQKELLIWHWKLGHANFQWIQTLCRHPTSDSPRCVLPTKLAKTSSCPAPKCAACMLGKQSRRTPTLKIGHQLPNKELLLKTNHLSPGDCVSLDQYQSTIPGRLEHTYGKEKKEERYTGGTIFVDHASGLMYLQHQVSLRVGETLKAKHAFEQMARDFSVSIKTYHADNMPFGNGEFIRSIEDSGQSIKFSGVGAHHQNGVAERAIQTVSSWARTMLLHATIHWPEIEHLHLWPFALQHAAFLWNNLPNRTTGVAPIEIFSGVSLSTFEHLTRSHVWGCPVYVLDPKLQDGKKLPKWQARARRGQYLGTSPDHSSTVGLIHNLRTGFISPQYHVIYDDLFSSVPNAESGGLPHAQEFNGEFWRRLIETGLESILPDDDVDSVPPLHHDWLTDAERAARLRDHDAHRLHLDPLIRPVVDGGITTPSNNAPNQPRPSAPEGAHAPDTDPLAPEGASNPNDFDDITDEIIFTDPSEAADDASISTTTSTNDPDVARRRDHLSTPDPETHGRGKRHRKPNRHLFDERLWANTAFFPRGSSYPKQKVLREQLNSQFLQSLSWEQAMDTIKSSDLRRMEHVLLQNTNPYTNTLEEMHPMALSTKANAADHPTWEQAMNGSEAKGYWEACKKELHTLETKRDAWEVVQRQPWMKVLPSTWAFRCKRYPDGSVRKLKARFCARGDKQIEGVDCFDTFAPVVNWTTVRLMLILTLILNLATCQVDYTAAFVHAPIDTDVYLDMPRGFAEPNKVYRLKRSLYGLRQSPRNFFQHLKSKLEAVGLQSQEQVDPCLFMSDKVIVLVYVDDTLFYSPRKEWIDEVIKKIEKQDLELEIEDSVAGFLGVHIERNDKDGTIKLTQKGLIKRIIDALQIQNLPRKLTPATKEPLVADKDGMPPQGRFSYPSVIGMLQYLQGHSRPDITYAVSQCSRYTHNPKRSHEIALEHIGQYLKHTQDEGLVLKPSHDNLNVDCFVDADFAGLWPYEDKQDPSCVKSRTGFTLCIANCPVIWTSKLQTDIATSTMEAEYSALSLAMKSVIPLQDLLSIIGKGVGMTNEQLTTFKTTVWEDNVGALTLANMEPGRVTPRSKFYAIKYHWFRSHLKPNKITIEKIATDQQRADIFTKGLTNGIFQNIRKLLCGWLSILERECQYIYIYIHIYIYIYITNWQECYGTMLKCDANTHNIIPGYITYPTKNKQTE